jgi:hypothetical protein
VEGSTQHRQPLDDKREPRDSPLFTIWLWIRFWPNWKAIAGSAGYLLVVALIVIFRDLWGTYRYTELVQGIEGLLAVYGFLCLLWALAVSQIGRDHNREARETIGEITRILALFSLGVAGFFILAFAIYKIQSSF